MGTWHSFGAVEILGQGLWLLYWSLWGIGEGTCGRYFDWRTEGFEQGFAFYSFGKTGKEPDYDPDS